MARWEPNTEQRLSQAALELYRERGYERTTVADIAARAGLTERTYFRYFADKREALFAGSADLEAAMVQRCASAPGSATPFEAVAAALDAAAEVLERFRDRAATRYAVIAGSPELLEREVMKRATLSSAIAGALRSRAVEPHVAELVAGAGVTVFHIGYERWVRSGLERSLAAEFADALAALQAASAPQ